MAIIPVHDIEGKKIEEFEISDEIIGSAVNTDVLHQAIVMYQANQRQGNASTKERGSVNGTSKKAFRQKGTGRARAGSMRSPLWRKGGVVFGPHPRDFGYSIPLKMKRAALRESLNAKYLSNDLYCIDRLDVTSTKTKDFYKILLKLNLNAKTLALWDQSDTNIQRVSRNIPFFSLIRVEDVNAYDMLANKKILVTKAALKNLIKRVT